MGSFRLILALLSGLNFSLFSPRKFGDVLGWETGGH